MNTDTRFLIYFTAVASFPTGRLPGVWIDLNQCRDVTDIERHISKMMKKYKRKEDKDKGWVVYDYMFPCKVPDDFEYTTLKDVWDLYKILSINL